MAQTLYELYKAQGKALPSVDSVERTNLAQSAGVGTGYTGSGAQNNAIVNYLKTKSSTGAGATGATPTTGATVPLVTPPVVANNNLDKASLAYSGNQELTDLENSTNTDATTAKKNYQDAYNEVKRQMQERRDAATRAGEAEKAQIAKNFEQRRNQVRMQQIRSGIVGSGADTAQLAAEDAELQKANSLVDEKTNATINDTYNNENNAQITTNKELGDYISKTDEKLAKIREGRNTDKATKLAGLNAYFAAVGVDPKDKNQDDLEEIAKTYGVSKNQILASYQTYKQGQDRQALGDAKTMAETAKLNAEAGLSNAKARGSTGSTGGSVLKVGANGAVSQVSSGGTFDTSNLSPQAQNILAIMNKNGGSVDDYAKDTKINAALRKELFGALASQGGVTEKAKGITQEAKDIVDNLVTTDAAKEIGGYSSVLGGQFLTGYGDAKAKAKQLTAILAKDNLGLLKGAMSDKDIAFIESMSSGFNGEGIQSEGYVNDRLKEIQTKLSKQLDNKGNTKVSAEEQALIDAGYVKQ